MIQFSNINKKDGFDVLVKTYHLKLKDSIVIADGTNDIELLKNAGIAIVMANADDKVKKYATYIADNVENDGVLECLKNIH